MFNWKFCIVHIKIQKKNPVPNFLCYMSSVNSGFRQHFKGGVSEKPASPRLVDNRRKLNKDENMIGSINAADRKTKPITENDTAELSLHSRLENTWQNYLI